jgi:hypothetical protein
MKTLNRIFSKVALLLIVFVIPPGIHAQVNYAFAATTGTFTPNAGATTIIASGNDDALSATQNIGFTFTYGCNTYTQFKACSNGFMSLGATAAQTMYVNSLVTTGQGPLLAPLWDDLSTGTTGSVNYVLTGTAPNRVLTVEWLAMRWNYQATGGVISFQVKLYETTNVIEFLYRQEATAVNSASATIGLSGGSAATDLYSLTGTGTAPTAVYGVETANLAAKPASNQLYRFTPGTQPYVGTVVTQASTAAASKCETSQAVIGVQVVTSACLATTNVTQLQLNMTGSSIPGTNTNDVSKIHIYYTGTSPVMATSNEFVSGGITPAAGTITANGSQALAAGTNYFWITYDINYNAATTGNVIDAQCTQVTVGGVNRTPSVTAPAGSRAIAACSVAPGSIKSNLAFWVKANTGTSATTNATNVTTWSDQSGNAHDATQATAANSPVYYDNSANNINFNPVVDFDDAAQSTTDGDFMDITSGGILSSGSNPYAVYAVIKPGPNNASKPGKFLFSGVVDPAGNTFNSFDIRSGGSFNDSWDLNDLIVANQWTAGYPSLAAFNFNSSYREMFVTGTSVGTKAGSERVSPDQNNALGCQRSATNREFFDGSIAEVVSYVNTSHDVTTRNKVASYLAVKYGITLGHNYLSSIGTTVWDRAINAAYNNNIVGIARDDNSGLSQKQSKSTSVVQDILTLYIGGAKQVNQVNNTGTFATGDRSFFMAANNGDPYLYTTTPTEVPAGICCRLRREWLSQKTNFTNTDLKLEFDFNVISPGYSPLNAADLRLLVDADGNFSNATVLGSPAITITSVGSVVTVTVAASNFSLTPYFTLASASPTTSLPVQFISFTAACRDEAAQLNWTVASDINTASYAIERSSNGRDYAAVSVVAGKGSAAQQFYVFADGAPLPGASYYRIKATDANGSTVYSPVVLFHGCTANMVRLATSPVSGESELVLQLTQNAQVQINLFDVTGRAYNVPNVTGRQNRTQGVYHIPVSNSMLSTGVYFVTVTVNGNKTVYRVVKQ